MIFFRGILTRKKCLNETSYWAIKIIQIHADDENCLQSNFLKREENISENVNGSMGVKSFTNLKQIFHNWGVTATSTNRKQLKFAEVREGSWNVGQNLTMMLLPAQLRTSLTNT